MDKNKRELQRIALRFLIGGNRDNVSIKDIGEVIFDCFAREEVSSLINELLELNANKNNR